MVALLSSEVITVKIMLSEKAGESLWHFYILNVGAYSGYRKIELFWVYI